MYILFDIHPAVFHEESPLRFLLKYYRIIYINKEVCFMKRIQQACICQTLRFFLKDDFPKSQAEQQLAVEVQHYKDSLVKNRVAHKILEL